MEGGRMVDGRRPSVMASLTEVRAVPRTLTKFPTDSLIVVRLLKCVLGVDGGGGGGGGCGGGGGGSDDRVLVVM